jgi:predicted  nucleic acid-binding Zn-ribbon protein
MLESFGKKKNDLLNDIIQLTNILNGQEAELDSVYDSSARLDGAINRSKKRMEDTYKKVSSTYSQLLSNFAKITKSLENEGALRKSSKKRTSVLGDVDPKAFMRRGDRLKTEVPTANNFDNDLGEGEEGEAIDRPESLEPLTSCLLSMQKLQQDMTSLKRLVKLANENINKYVSSLESELQQVFTCKNCFQKYTQLTNGKNSCSYHPGKSKYYYCKSCDSDEYFSCCHSCVRCKPACKVGQHMPILMYRTIK